MMSDVPEPDFSGFARRPSERLAIVRYVLGTPGLQETDYLEWKSGYDLSKRTGAASTARQLIGMANRDEGQAVRHAEGRGYVLVGVEPEKLEGVPVWDSADIENWLSPFVDERLRYDQFYVQVDERNVLFLAVDPPRRGDPIYSLRATSQDPAGKSLREGTIYVRHGSRTEPANATDIDRLSLRVADAADDAKAVIRGLELELDDSLVAVINPDLLTDEFRDAEMDSWQKRMLRALPKDRLLMGGLLNENRRQDFYVDEVAGYCGTIVGTPGLWTRFVMGQILREEATSLSLFIKNDSEENYENAVVEVTFVGLGRGNICAHASEAQEILKLPSVPLEWEKKEGVDLSGIEREQLGIDIEERGAGEVFFRFPELRIRPHTRHKLPALLLALPPVFARMAIAVHWRVTASNTKSEHVGDTELHIPARDEEEPGSPSGP